MYVFSLTHAGCLESSPSLQDKVFDTFQELLIPHHLRDESSYSCLWYVARHCVLLVEVRVDQSDCFIQQLYRKFELLIAFVLVPTPSTEFHLLALIV